MAVTFKKKSSPKLDPKHPDVKKKVMDAVYVGNQINKVTGIKLLRNLTGLSLKEAVELIEAWMDTVTPVPKQKAPTLGEIVFPPEFDNLSMENLPVKLSEATKLHQPVNGTSTGSRYHTIAIGSIVNVATRIRDDLDVMIRAEIKEHHASGSAQKAGQALIKAGFDKKPKGHYSLNLEPEDFDMAQRSIGSTLFATGIKFDMVSTQLILLKGVGK